MALLTTMRDAMITAINNERPDVNEVRYAGAARALRARLLERTSLSPDEQALLGDWLDRLVSER